MKVGIYKIVSPNNKIYIGQSININRRMNQYKNQSCQAQKKLYNSINKYGWESHKFEIIHELPEDVKQEVLDRYEQLYIDLYRDCDFELMNLREAGIRGKLSEEGRKKLLSYNIGKTMSKESIEKMIETKKRNYIKENHPMYGKLRGEEVKQKISKTKLSKKIKQSEEIIEKRFKNNKKVLQYTLDNALVKEWRSANQAFKTLNISADSIRKCCRNEFRHAGKFIWKYKNNTQ